MNVEGWQPAMFPATLCAVVPADDQRPRVLEVHLADGCSAEVSLSLTDSSQAYALLRRVHLALEEEQAKRITGPDWLDWPIQPSPRWPFELAAPDGSTVPCTLLTVYDELDGRCRQILVRLALGYDPWHWPWCTTLRELVGRGFRRLGACPSVSEVRRSAIIEAFRQAGVEWPPTPAELWDKFQRLLAEQGWSHATRLAWLEATA